VRHFNNPYKNQQISIKQKQLPPGQAKKKIYGGKSAKRYAPDKINKKRPV
jgi:hypothetical protein